MTGRDGTDSKARIGVVRAVTGGRVVTERVVKTR